MKIEFETDINGYQEARQFKLLIDSILRLDKLDVSSSSLALSIQEQLNEFISKPEFADFTSDGSDDLFTASHNETSTSSLSKLFSGFFGPSRQEIELSKQRQTLIARAEHAEHSAFEALAETAEIGRERDQLKEKLKQLEARLSDAE